MKKILLIFVIVGLYTSSFAVDSAKLNIQNYSTSIEQAEPASIKKIDIQPTKNEIPVPKKRKRKLAPGNIPSFWWSFTLSAIGSYTIYGIGAGPISVLVVYFSTDANKKEVRRAMWGWITGTIVGLGLWAILKM